MTDQAVNSDAGTPKERRVRKKPEQSQIGLYKTPSAPTDYLPDLQKVLSSVFTKVARASGLRSKDDLLCLEFLVRCEPKGGVGVPDLNRAASRWFGYSEKESAAAVSSTLKYFETQGFTKESSKTKGLVIPALKAMSSYNRTQREFLANGRGFSVLGEMLAGRNTPATLNFIARYLQQDVG